MQFKENPLFRKSRYSIIWKLKSYIITLLFYILRCFPIDSQKIVVCSYRGLGLKGNPKYIVEYLMEQNIECKLVCLTRKKYGLSKRIKEVPYHSIRSLYELATAAIWIDDCRKEEYVRKRKKQYYIQTWHGGIGPKRVEKDVSDKLSKSYVQGAKRDSKMADLFISNSTFETNLYRKSFWYEGLILEAGLPRNDIFFKSKEFIDKITAKVRKYFNVSNETKIILYAPTFRQDFKVEHHQIDFTRICKNLRQTTGKNWVTLIHLHPNVALQSNLLSYSEININASIYQDIQELMCAADVLITDYSSIMFDFALLGRPVFLYMFDREEYVIERNFYFDLDKLPFPIAETFDELSWKIKTFDNELYQRNLSSCLKKFGLKETGQSCEFVTAKIIEILR